MAAPNPFGVGKQVTELKFFAFQTSNTQLYHNVPLTAFNTTSLLDTISIGTGYGNRIGNRIVIERIRASFVLNNKPDRPNVSYRVVCIAAPATESTNTYAELFAGGVFTGHHVPANSLLLHDTTFPQNQGSGMDNNVTPNKERSFTYRFEVPISKPVVYNSASGYASTCISVYVLCYDAFGTLTTDNIASVAQSSIAFDYTDG